MEKLVYTEQAIGNYGILTLHSKTSYTVYPRVDINKHAEHNIIDYISLEV